MTVEARQIRGSVSYHAGLAAEQLVLRHYERRGFTLAVERWHGKRGEIDLILHAGAAVVFVEVKQSQSFDRAALRITSRQQARIYASAEEYLATRPDGSLTESRFDVALVDQRGAVQVIENAFGHD